VNETLRRTPLHDRHAALGARFVGFAGWEMPVQYSGVTREHEAVRQRVGLFDVSHMGELFFGGPEAVAVLDRAVTNDIAGLAVGQARYTASCNEHGGILDDLIVYRLAAQRFMVVCNAGNRAKMAAHFAEQARGRCDYRDRSDDYALLALQGPAAPQTLAALGAERALLDLPRFALAETRLCGVDVICARTGYTGEDGYELFCENAGAGALWDQALATGAAAGIAPIGLGARDTLRLEARLLLYGNDIDETTNPYEAGIGWTVKLDKPALLGGAALQAVKRDGVARKLVGFEMVERGIGRHGYPIVDASGNVVGQVTSGAPSLSLGKNVGLGYVPAALSRVGTRLAIEIRGQSVAAEVVPTPFYKRKA
jgi:aminomethyltransferase